MRPTMVNNQDRKSRLIESFKLNNVFVCFLSNDLDKLMVSAKLFYKPDQLKSELKESDRAKLVDDGGNELVYIDFEPLQHYDVDAIKSKCCILNADKYAK